MTDESKPKHDGKLVSIVAPRGYDDYTSHIGMYEEGNSHINPLIEISGGYIVGYVVEEASTYLDAKQALSLLAWLTQERETLERLVKEREQDDNDLGYPHL